DPGASNRPHGLLEVVIEWEVRDYWGNSRPDIDPDSQDQHQDNTDGSPQVLPEEVLEIGLREIVVAHVTFPPLTESQQHGDGGGYDRHDQAGRGFGARYRHGCGSLNQCDTRPTHPSG